MYDPLKIYLDRGNGKKCISSFFFHSFLVSSGGRYRCAIVNKIEKTSDESTRAKKLEMVKYQVWIDHLSLLLQWFVIFIFPISASIWMFYTKLQSVTSETFRSHERTSFASVLFAWRFSVLLFVRLFSHSGRIESLPSPKTNQNASQSIVACFD